MTDIAAITTRKPVLIDEMKGGKPDETLWHHSISPYDGYISERILTTGEQQVYVDTALLGRSQLFPVGDTCAFMAQPMDGGTRKKIDALIASQKPVAAAANALKKADHVSACLSSKQAFQFGYVEANIALGANPAGWPGFWLYARTNGRIEIDVLEYIDADGMMRSHIHADKVTALMSSIVKPSSWHLYGALWTSGRVEFFLDRKSIGALTYDPKYDAPAYLILNLAVGGWAPKPLPDPKDQIKMQVDRVAWWSL